MAALLTSVVLKSANLLEGTVHLHRHLARL